jgi:glycerate dehydrogenase
LIELAGKTLDELLDQSDVISLHCPLSDSTKGIINRNTITKMKDGVILVNTSRGPLIVEEELAAALATGKNGRFFPFALPSLSG